MLADLGAEVVKVEVPNGEVYRHGRPKFSGFESDFPESPPFHMDNRGKRSLGLDLTRPGAPEALLRVIDGVDIFITNLLPARRVKYGLDHESLLARNPRLLVGAINGYGLGGEEADRPAFDYAAYWARTGLMDMMRDEGVPPSLLRPGVGDHAAAMNLVCGLLAAMRMRDATGEGRYVEVSLLQTGLHILGTDLANTLVTREPPHRHDRRKTSNPLWNSYPVAGDRWLLLVMIDSQSYWPAFCDAIERPELREDERYADPWKRHQNAAELIGTLEEVFLARTLPEWRERLDAARLIWSPVQRVEEMIDDEQARAMGYFYELDHDATGRFETVGPPFRIEGTEIGARRGAPSLASDSRDVLREAGLSDEDIAKLID